MHLIRVGFRRERFGSDGSHGRLAKRGGFWRRDWRRRGGRRRSGGSRWRNRSGLGGRSRRGRRRGCRRRGGGTSRRKQRQWIDVRVVVADPNAEMDIGNVVLRLSGRPGLGYRVTFDDGRATPYEQLPEMGQRCLVTIVSGDGHREPVSGNLARKRDLSARGRAHDARVVERDVHSPVLASGVLVVRDRELAEDRPICRPCPRPRDGRHRKRTRCCSGAHECPPRCPSSEHVSTVARGLRAGNAIGEVVTESRGTGRSWTLRSALRRPPRPSGAAHQPTPARQRPREPSPTHLPPEDLPQPPRSRS